MTALPEGCQVPAGDGDALAKAIEQKVRGKQCRVLLCAHGLLSAMLASLSARAPAAGQVALLPHLQSLWVVRPFQL